MEEKTEIVLKTQGMSSFPQFFTANLTYSPKLHINTFYSGAIWLLESQVSNINRNNFALPSTVIHRLREITSFKILELDKNIPKLLAK